MAYWIEINGRRVSDRSDDFRSLVDSAKKQVGMGWVIVSDTGVDILTEEWANDPNMMVGVEYIASHPVETTSAAAMLCCDCESKLTRDGDGYFRCSKCG
jgi:tRNA(Ile2) C34 agmatinyltransferase TiaS